MSQSKAAWQTARPLLGKLIKWTVWAVLALNISVITLYTVGSYQRADDQSQLALVRICLVVSLLLVISSIYGIVLDLYYALRRQKAAYLAGVLGYMLIIVLGFCTALAAAFIIGAVGGNR